MIFSPRSLQTSRGFKAIFDIFPIQVGNSGESRLYYRLMLGVMNLLPIPALDGVM
jgi:hypothetical protein